LDADEPAAPPPVTGERYGPLVHRSVHHGAILYIVGVLVFVLAMAITQIGFSGTSYSLLHNYISDLGAAHCGYYHSPTLYICSPWHDVFNAGIIVMGLLLILGTILLRTAFPARGSRTVGLALLVLAGVGAIGVGLSPEDVNLTVHTLSAAVAFIFGNLALVILAFAMFRDTRWNGYRAYTLFSGLVGLIAFVLFYVKVYGPLGVGGMERLIVAPLLLWAVVIGIHLVRIPTFAPAGVRVART
jgi:hypothetical membrane protein